MGSVNDTWVKNYRKIQEWRFYKRPDYAHLWQHIIRQAHHDTKSTYDGYGNEVKCGQFSTGRKRLSSETGIHESKVERILKHLEIEQQIEQRKTSKCRIISITNWSQFQQANNKRTTSEQQVNNKRTQNKNGKNGKNGKNKEIKKSAVDFFGKDYSGNWLLKEVELKSLISLVDEYGKSTVEKYLESVSDYCLSKDKTYKNYIAATRSFMKRDGVSKLVIDKSKLDLLLEDQKPECGGLMEIVQ